MNVLLRNCLKKPRVCIKNYLEDVADQYSEEEFRRHFRISKSLYDSMAKKFQCTDYKTGTKYAVNCRETQTKTRTRWAANISIYSIFPYFINNPFKKTLN